MLKAGESTKMVAQRLNVNIRSVQRWWRSDNLGYSMDSMPKSRRPPKIDRVAKIVITKSLGKRRQSTRKIASRLTRGGCNVSHMSVHRYLRGSLGVKPYKRPKRPRLTIKMRENRMKFAEAHKDWTVSDWNRVLWSDESPFELFQTPNRQNDRVWSKEAGSIEPCIKVKFPAKIQVWGIMSHRALSELHIIPQRQTVNGEYYRTNILAGTCKDAINKRAENGSVLVRSTSEMSEIIFMQDGAPAHTAKLTQEWCEQNLPAFWHKAKWPGNSPDLNPIENLWAIVKDKIEQLEQATTVCGLIKNVKKAWSSISSDVLQNMVSSMPKRVNQVLERQGDYIQK